jgi:hypothetical protein
MGSKRSKRVKLGGPSDLFANLNDRLHDLLAYIIAIF